MKALVVNCGSSSLKYQLFEMPEAVVLAKGIVEKIGNSKEEGRFEQKANGKEIIVEQMIPDHDAAMQLVVQGLTDSENGALNDLSEIGAVGHRVLHAGDKISGSVLVTKDVIDVVEEFSELGPLHNPANLMGIRAVERLMPGVPNVAVFDTAFHQTMPKEAFLYPIPYEYYEKYRIRRYGFHGTSHRYVTGEAIRILGTAAKDTNLITVHLGNGCSLTAVKGGKSFDTSMGLTPLEGVMMGTRSGDIDPAIIPWLMNKTGATASEIDAMLNKQSGLLAVSGVSNDMRTLNEASAKGNERAKLAVDMFVYRVKKWIGQYMAALGRVDAIVFTGGIGENDVNGRAAILEGLEFWGIEADPAKNTREARAHTFIEKDSSKVRIMVIPTDEEKVIAEDAYEIVTKRR